MATLQVQVTCMYFVHAANKKTSSPDRDEVSKSPVIDAQEYIAIDSYEAQGPGQISFEEAEVITVFRQNGGW